MDTLQRTPDPSQPTVLISPADLNALLNDRPVTVTVTMPDGAPELVVELDRAPEVDDDPDDTEWASDSERDRYVDAVVNAWRTRSKQKTIIKEYRAVYGQCLCDSTAVAELAERDACDGPAFVLFPELLDRTTGEGTS